MELEQIARIGAMAYAEQLVPRGPRIQERAEALLLALLQLQPPVTPLPPGQAT